MAISATLEAPVDSPLCSIQRTLDIVGERWTFLILREALIEGETKFAGFEKMLGIAPNILSDRLNTLVSAGIMEKSTYKEDGARARNSYHPTPMGMQLKLVLAAMQQWGDDYVPPSVGVTQLRVAADSKSPVRLAFVDADNKPRALEDVAWVNTPTYPAEARAARRAAK